jgi:hypothetical protein
VKSLLKGHKIRSAALVLLGVVGALMSWDASAHVRGQAVARFDVARGQYRILALGLPVEWRPEYFRLLRERYGVEARVVAGCIVSQPLLEYAAGYNAVTVAATNRRFGRDVFRETMMEAAKTRKARPASAAQ